MNTRAGSCHADPLPPPRLPFPRQTAAGTSRSCSACALSMLSHQLWCLGHHHRRVPPVPPLLCSVGWGRGLGQASMGGFPTALTAPRAAGAEWGCRGPQFPQAEPPGTWEQGQDRDRERGGGGGRAAGVAPEGCCQRPQDGTLGVGTVLQNKGSAQSPACSSCPAPHPAALSCSPIAWPHRTAPSLSPIPQPHPGRRAGARCDVGGQTPQLPEGINHKQDPWQ